MRSTTASGDTTNGVVPSSQAQDCALMVAAAQNSIEKKENLMRVKSFLAPR